MDERRRKLQFRAWRRGFRELDLIIGSFADKHLESMTEAEVDGFEQLLKVQDWEMFSWLTGTAAIPPHRKGPLLQRLCDYEYTAQPG